MGTNTEDGNRSCMGAGARQPGGSPLRGRTQPIDLVRDEKEGLAGTDTDEHWGFEVTKTGEYKVQDIHGGETSGEST